jgi:hypothetical protein
MPGLKHASSRISCRVQAENFPLTRYSQKARRVQTTAITPQQTRRSALLVSRHQSKNFNTLHIRELEIAFSKRERDTLFINKTYNLHRI